MAVLTLVCTSLGFAAQPSQASSSTTTTQRADSSVSDAVPASVPSPGPTTAVVNINVGGDRDTATTTGPLAGVRLGLYTGQTGGQPVYTCTSDDDGDCSFEVDTSGNQSGVQYWVRQIEAPAGWRLNDDFRTGTSASSPSEDYRFQTPALHSNTTYDSATTAGFMFPTQNAAGNNRTSSGTWQVSRDNPPLPDQCGLKVALVVDLSGSMQGSVGDLKGAMNTFVDALRGTPSTMSLVTFSRNSPAENAENVPGLHSVATTADANRFKQNWNGWTENTASGGTNWDEGLWATASLPATYDAAVFITDGRPTYYGPGPSGNGSRTRFTEMEQAIFSANALKSKGTRVIAVGVGDGVGDAQAPNLKAISGTTSYDGTNVAAADFFQTAQFDQAGQALRQMALAPCTPTVSVTKQIVPNGGTVDDAVTAGPGWEFTASPASDGVSIDPPSTQTTGNDNTGTVSFRLSYDDTTSGTVGVTEEQQPGYTLLPQNGDNATCVDRTNDNAPVPVTNDPGGGAGFTLPTTVDSAISCTIYNEAPPDVQPAELHVDKSWVVHNGPEQTTYTDGDQPEGLDATLHVTPPGGGDPIDSGWGETRSGYESGENVTIDETTSLAPPGCELTSSHIETPGGNESLPHDATLDAGTNEFTVVNEVTCQSNLTVDKEVRGGPADPGSWTLTATAPDGAPAGPSGSAPVTGEVQSGVPYGLSERPDPANPDLLNYRSIGDPTCAILDENGDPVGGYTDGANSQVTVPLGEHVTCAFVNEAVSLTLTKHVDGPADPSNWSLHADPVDPDPEDLPAQQVAGSADGKQIWIRPGQEYRISESGGVPGYEQTDLDCTIDGDPVNGNTLTVESGESAECTIANAQILSELTVQKTDAVSGDTLNGADFDLVRDANDNGKYDEGTDETVDSCTTADPDGTCSIGDLGFGTYFWVETAAPPGYDLPANPVSDAITIDGDNAGTDIATHVQQDPQTPSQLTVEKVDQDGGPLAGADFDLAVDSNGDNVFDPDDDDVVDSCTTADPDGTCSIGDLGFGTYFWVETGAPAGYEIPANNVSDPITIDADNAGTDIEPFTLANTQKLSELTVQKVDSESGVSLSGADFDLVVDNGDGEYDPETDTTVVDSCTTAGANGTCTIGDLGFGTYFWIETAAPDGYQQPNPDKPPVSDAITIDADNAGTDIDTFVAPNDQLRSSLTVKKVSGDDTPLAGADFDLARDANANGTYDKDADEVVDSCTTGDPHGTCSVGDLGFGTYFWVETAAPDGYDPPANPVSDPITIDADNAGTDIEPFVMVNTRHGRFKPTVRKLDAHDDRPLSGADFNLVLDDGDGEFDADTDAKIGSCTTGDPEGTCSIGDLDAGTYFWVETAAPQGYRLPKKSVSDPVTINRDTGSGEPTTFRDPRLPTALTVRKVAEDTGDTLSGARFSLYRDDGDGVGDGPDDGDRRVGTCTTRNTGECSVDGLDFGDYYWYEVSAPSDYLLPDDRTSDVVTIDASSAGESHTTTFTDPPGPSGEGGNGGEGGTGLPGTGGPELVALLGLAALLIGGGTALMSRARRRR